MSHEQIAPKFNIDKFKSEFETLFEEYLINGEKAMHPPFDPDVEFSEEDYNKLNQFLKQEELHKFGQVATLLAQALKLATNKQEIIDITSANILKCWMERSNPNDEYGDPLTDDHARASLWEKVIIELLKK